MSGLESLTVHAYAAVDGRHLTRLPYASASWSDSINEPGQMSVDMTMSSLSHRLTVDGQSIRAVLRPWRAIDLVGRVIVSGTALVHLGSNAVENRHGRGLRHVERASIIHKDVDGMAQQSRLRLATGLAVKTA